MLSSLTIRTGHVPRLRNSNTHTTDPSSFTTELDGHDSENRDANCFIGSFKLLDYITIRTEVTHKQDCLLFLVSVLKHNLALTDLWSVTKFFKLFDLCLN
jgi:hypothetical protein